MFKILRNSVKFWGKSSVFFAWVKYSITHWSNLSHFFLNDSDNFFSPTEIYFRFWQKTEWRDLPEKLKIGFTGKSIFDSTSSSYLSKIWSASQGKLPIVERIKFRFSDLNISDGTKRKATHELKETLLFFCSFIWSLCCCIM